MMPKCINYFTALFVLQWFSKVHVYWHFEDHDIISAQIVDIKLIKIIRTLNKDAVGMTMSAAYGSSVPNIYAVPDCCDLQSCYITRVWYQSGYSSVLIIYL